MTSPIASHPFRTMLAVGLLLSTVVSCKTTPDKLERTSTQSHSKPISKQSKTGLQPGTWIPRRGMEMMVAGQLVYVGTPIVLWLDPGGYDAYRVERRFAPFTESSWEAIQESKNTLSTPNRYGLRKDGLSEGELDRVRGGGWDVPTLQSKIDQFVLHFDACGTSRRCFEVLHDLRCLSVHFMLDQDGTIYQTLDLKERAWHATTSNTRSIGIEIANIGAYAVDQREKLDPWYRTGENGRTEFVVPAWMQPTGYRKEDFRAFPSRNEPIEGRVQGMDWVQYDFTDAQYQALIRLTAALCKVFPNLKCDYPKDSEGDLIPHQLEDDVLTEYSGILGHYHIQSNKIDPGPAFDWERLMEGTKGFLKDSQ